MLHIIVYKNDNTLCPTTCKKKIRNLQRTSCIFLNCLVGNRRIISVEVILVHFIERKAFSQRKCEDLIVLMLKYIVKNIYWVFTHTTRSVVTTGLLYTMKQMNMNKWRKKKCGTFIFFVNQKLIKLKCKICVHITI